MIGEVHGPASQFRRLSRASPKPSRYNMFLIQNTLPGLPIALTYSGNSYSKIHCILCSFPYIRISLADFLHAVRDFYKLSRTPHGYVKGTCSECIDKISSPLWDMTERLCASTLRLVTYKKAQYLRMLQ